MQSRHGVQPRIQAENSFAQIFFAILPLHTEGLFFAEMVAATSGLVLSWLFHGYCKPLVVIANKSIISSTYIDTMQIPWHGHFTAATKKSGSQHYSLEENHGKFASYRLSEDQRLSALCGNQNINHLAVGTSRTFPCSNSPWQQMHCLEGRGYSCMASIQHRNIRRLSDGKDRRTD